MPFGLINEPKLRFEGKRIFKSDQKILISALHEPRLRFEGKKIFESDQMFLTGGFVGFWTSSIYFFKQTIRENKIRSDKAKFVPDLAEFYGLRIFSTVAAGLAATRFE